MIDTSFSRHWIMHTPHATTGLATVANSRGRQPPRVAVIPPQPLSRPEPRTLRVGLIAGPEATWDLAAARVAEHLRRDQSLEVFYAWDCVELGIDDPSDYDCLVLLGWPTAATRERIKRIELYCRAGGSLVALRAMHADIPGWPTFAEEVLGGYQPTGQKSRLLEVHRSDSAWHHPVLESVETMVAEGEVYSGPRFAPDKTVLLTADVGRRQMPVAWTMRHEGGRIFCSTLGLQDDFRQAAFLRLISNAVRWTGLVHDSP
jgi:hypothetical protein